MSLWQMPENRMSIWTSRGPTARRSKLHGSSGADWLFAANACVFIGPTVPRPAPSGEVCSVQSRERQPRQGVFSYMHADLAESLHKESCNVASLVNEAIKTQRRTAIKQGIRLRFDGPVGLSVF